MVRRYSIRYVTEDAGPCLSCNDCEEIGRGPIGFYNGKLPVCDWCLLMGDRDLGALLVMAHLFRELHRLRGGLKDADNSREALAIFAAWARFYGQDADRKWPPRMVAMVSRLVYNLHPDTEPS